MFRNTLLFKLLILLSFAPFANAEIIPGYLAPKESGDGPATVVWAETYQPRSTFAKSAYTDLLDYILPSPDQEEAGSCLYMSITGNVEWWLHRLRGDRDPKPEGARDLSERHLIHLSHSYGNQLSNFLTDTVFLFNINGQKALLNNSYRFTKGWAKYSNGAYQKAKPYEAGASYTTSYNWIYEKPHPKATSVRLPKFDREVIYKDPKDNRWAINSMPNNIVEKIKAKLRERKAPVLVVYNHYLVWHAVMIVGYDDQESTNGCKFTTGFVDYTKKLSDEAFQNGEVSKGQNYLAQSQAVDRAQRAEGGCQEKGVFLVRDSIYDWPEGPIYDYDLNNTGDEIPYSAPVIKKEYQWLKRFGNHAYQIYVK